MHERRDGRLPDDGELRRFALSLGAMLVVAALVLARGGHDRVVPALLGLALAAALGGLSPRAILPLHRLFAALSGLLGRVASPLVLLAVFLLVVTPLGLLRRLLRRRRLELGPGREESYWREAEPPQGADRMRRQF